MTKLETDIIAALERGLADVCATGPESDWTVASEPIPTYGLGFDDLGDPDPLSHAMMTGWSVMTGGTVPGIVKVRPQLGGMRFSGIGFGHVDAFRKALEHARKAVRDGDELRLVWVDALGSGAFWLSGGGGERLVPFLWAGNAIDPETVDAGPEAWPR